MSPIKSSLLRDLFPQWIAGSRLGLNAAPNPNGSAIADKNKVIGNY
jgi:hypothetical protein